MKDPPIPVLDEATAMFDPEGEVGFIEESKGTEKLGKCNYDATGSAPKKERSGLPELAINVFLRQSVLTIGFCHSFLAP